nr:hypothetical protein [Tanacetum cinerariifolium]
ACEGYGKVIDLFIPYRRSKAGKRFAFVRFIHVMDLDRLVGNLCTIWIGRYHLHANATRFERANKLVKPLGPSQSNVHGSFALVVRGSPKPNDTIGPLSSLTALVLDDFCVVNRDLSCHAMGRVKDICSIPNLWILLAKEGFEHMKLSFLGDFDERVVWVDIEGILFNVWSRETFSKIGKKWRDALDIEYNSRSSFARKCLCVLTKQPRTILENFKLSDEESDGDREVDGVLETYFTDNSPLNRPDTVTSPRVDARVIDHSQEVHDSFNGEA